MLCTLAEGNTSGTQSLGSSLLLVRYTTACRGSIIILMRSMETGLENCFRSWRTVHMYCKGYWYTGLKAFNRSLNFSSSFLLVSHIFPTEISISYPCLCCIFIHIRKQYMYCSWDMYIFQAHSTTENLHIIFAVIVLPSLWIIWINSSYPYSKILIKW